MSKRMKLHLLKISRYSGNLRFKHILHFQRQSNTEEQIRDHSYNGQNNGNPLRRMKTIRTIVAA